MLNTILVNNVPVYRATDAGETVDFASPGAARWWLEMRETLRESRRVRGAR